MKATNYRYELRKVTDSDYCSHGDVSYWYFTNGVSSYTSPAGHSDARRFPSDTVVLCRLRKSTDPANKGYFLEGFAKVLKFSKDGKPAKFGDSLNNRPTGYWEPPTAGQIIYDERERGKVKKIK